MDYSKWAGGRDFSNYLLKDLCYEISDLLFLLQKLYLVSYEQAKTVSRTCSFTRTCSFSRIYEYKKFETRQ